MMRSLWCDREGTALIEAAVLVPMLFTLFLGVFEFGWLFYNQQLVSSGVRDAARYAAKSQAPCGGSTVTDAQNLATTGTINGTGAMRVTGWTAGSVVISCANIANNGQYNSIYTTVTVVTASTSYKDPSFGFFDFLGVPVPTISVSHQERGIPDSG